METLIDISAGNDLLIALIALVDNTHEADAERVQKVRPGDDPDFGRALLSGALECVRPYSIKPFALNRVTNASPLPGI